MIELDFLAEMEFFEADEAERDEMISRYGLEPLRKPIKQLGIAELRDWLNALDTAPQAGTMDELQASMCLSSSGTGSILDISRVTAEPDFNALFSLSRELLIDLFETDEPTRSTVEQWQMRIPSLHEPQLYRRNQGIYFTVYRDGRPDEIYIEGCSGD